jgi:4-hydroxybenzoate polyprenyltransferase
MRASEPPVSRTRRVGRASAARRLLASIRFGEVCVLQGTPIMGALFALDRLSPALLWPFGLLLAGNLCLIVHVFVLNDWAGIIGDARDPRRAGHTFLAHGTSPAAMGGMALACLGASLALFALLGLEPFVFGLLIALLSAVYSLRGKGVPVLSSLLHLVGGTLHFLLGAAAFAQIDGPMMAIAAYFGVVFAAGHLTHEARDHDGDRDNAIRTNAVAFGRRRAFVASLTLFALSYALMAVLAGTGHVPLALGAVAVVSGMIQAAAALRAHRAALTFEALRQLQSVYRLLHLGIGLTLLLTVPPW